MPAFRHRAALPLAIAATFGIADPAEAVYLNPDGLGQALVYPYYTARSVNGNAFNTLVSVANHTSQAKVVRVRFLEARNARAVQSLNVYLGPNDMWTGAVIPFGTEEARLVSSDLSCVNGPLASSFQSAAYTGANADSFGTGLDRTREGYIEVLEMATLTGNTAIDVTPGPFGTPSNCAAVMGEPTLQTAPPSGGLSGTLTVVNVANGSDFTINAEALANLTTQAFYRPPADPYPGFDAAEVTPVSVVVANGSAYRSTWPRGIDAVSAALMRRRMIGEFVLDAGTLSRTHVVTVFPTRRHYPASGTGTAPFQAAGSDQETFALAYYNRDERSTSYPGCSDFSGFTCSVSWQSPVTVLTLSNGSAHTASGTGVLGSRSGPRYAGGGNTAMPGDPVRIVQFPNGWLQYVPTSSGAAAGITSLPTSQRTDIATGQVVTGAHVHTGLPVVGFTLRTFENGTLACGAGSCQGNYGGAFPLKYRREITTP